MGIRTRAWLVINIITFSIVMIVIGILGINKTNSSAIDNHEGKALKFDTVTVGTINIDTTFKIRAISEKYSEKGELSYYVSFEATDVNIPKFNCEIPEKYKEKISKEATYSGSIKIAYVEEMYEAKKAEIGNKEVDSTKEDSTEEDSTEEDKTSKDNKKETMDKQRLADKEKFELICNNVGAYEILDINFMYKKFIQEKLYTLEEVKKAFDIKYLTPQEIPIKLDVSKKYKIAIKN